MSNSETEARREVIMIGCRLVCGFALLITLPTTVRPQLVNRLAVATGTPVSASGWQPVLGMGGDLITPALGRFRVALRAGFARGATSGTAPGLYDWQLDGGARLVTTIGTAGLWLGTDVVSREHSAIGEERPRITAGSWGRINGVLVAVSTSLRSTHLSTVVDETGPPRTVVDTIGDSVVVRQLSSPTSSVKSADSRWAETEASVIFERARWSADATLGGRAGSRGIPAGAWASGSIAIALVRPLSLVLGAGAATGARVFPSSERRFVSVALRVTPRFFRSAALPAPATPAPAVFSVARMPDGRSRLSVRVPHAQLVEIAGDFTGWKPTPLTRVEADSWELAVNLTPGTHRLNLRVDGGAWVAPPGTMTMTDDFAGEVGVIVVEAPAFQPRDSK